jgi:hypothetical protein
MQSNVMKLASSLLALFLVAFTCHADNECRDADGNIVEQAQCADDAYASAASTSGLPEDALAQVNELKVKMRYFKAIGFHQKSEQKREEIEAIYAGHGVPLPDEYKQ